MRPDIPRPVLLAVDGNSLGHRSFHALVGSNLRTPDGRPTWAVKGFCSQVLGALERVGADALVVGFDDHGNSVRKAQWPHYKATRKPKPPELGQQIAMTIELLRAAGIHVVVPEGLEADDVLASAARTAAAAGWNTVIVTSDRDSLPLVDQATSVLRIINGGVAASPLLNADRMTAFLKGVHAHQYRQYAAMRGDTSDNLAGLPGFGEKTAAKLLIEFGSIATVFADIDAGGERADRVAKVLGKANAAKLALPANRAAYAETELIMTMREDLDLGLGLADGGPGCLPIDVDRLTAALDDLGLASVRNTAVRLLTATAPKPASAGLVTPGAPAPGLMPPGHDQVPWPSEPPADEYQDAYEYRRTPTVDAAAATPAAMAGSTVARPAAWDDTLF